MPWNKVMYPHLKQVLSPSEWPEEWEGKDWLLTVQCTGPHSIIPY